METIKFNIRDTYTIAPRGGTFNIKVDYSACGTGSRQTPSIRDLDGHQIWWCSITELSTVDDVTEYSVSVTAFGDTPPADRSAYITFRFETPASPSITVYSKSLYIFQYTRLESIWKDSYFTFSIGYPVDNILSNVFAYDIRNGYNDLILVTGCANIGGDSKVNVSRIVDSILTPPDFNYTSGNTWVEYPEVLNTTLWFTPNFYNNNYPINHYLAGEKYFKYDWSYDIENYESDAVLNRPINNHANTSLYLPLTVFNAYGRTYYSYTKQGASTINTRNYGSPNYDICSVMATHSNIPSTVDRIEFARSDAQNTPILTYKLGYCGDYALYYFNKYGAYDVFLIEGNVKKIDNYDKYMYNKGFEYGSDQFAKNTIQNKITSSYELSTGWLTDNQSKTLAEQLLPSPKVYLQDLKSGSSTLIPVNITNNNVEHKIFKNGKNLNRYTITVDESQYKLVK